MNGHWNRFRVSAAELTCDAFTLLMDGVMRRAGSVHGTAQLLGLVVGGGLYELNG